MNSNNLGMYLSEVEVNAVKLLIENSLGIETVDYLNNIMSVYNKCQNYIVATQDDDNEM